ncbi:MAG: cellulose biosynthesis cyclic di-GMP-binding regulatory protein BcsB [Candidatus Nanopelagicales bacterium]
MTARPGRMSGLSLLLVSALMGMSVWLATPAMAASAPFPYNLSIKGGYGTAEVQVAMPDGTSPERLTGTVVSSYSTAGQILILVDGRVADSVPARRGGPVEIDLSDSQVHDGVVTISMKAALEPARDCLRDDEAVASLVNPRLQLDHAPAAPQTIAGFLSPAAAGFVVVVPQDPSPAEQAAGLDALLALRHISPSTTPVELTSGASPPATSAGRRTVVVTETPDPVNRLLVAGGRLRISGAGDSLADAATSLADPNTGLLEVTSATDLAGVANYAPVEGNSSLAQAGISSLTVSGIGRVSRTVPVSQATFGGPVSQVVFHLRGTATPVAPGQQGRVSVLWNDRLAASEMLNEDSRVALDFTIPPEDLVSRNRLTLELEYMPAGADCSDPPLPGKVDIDVAASRVAPTHGTSTGPGFQRFPQAFGPAIRVSALEPLTQSLPDLGAILSSVVADSPWQYTVELVPWDSLAATGGIATGVDAHQADTLGAPLPGQRDGADFPPGRTTAYSALQAFQSGESDLIVLSGEPAGPATALAQWTTTRDGGWSTLQGQVYVASEQTDPEPFETASTLPDKRTPQLIAASATSAVLLFALIIWLRRRPGGAES